MKCYFALLIYFVVVQFVAQNATTPIQYDEIRDIADASSTVSRKGRFIEVNQTAARDNGMANLVREKKSFENKKIENNISKTPAPAPAPEKSKVLTTTEKPVKVTVEKKQNARYTNEADCVCDYIMPPKDCYMNYFLESYYPNDCYTNDEPSLIENDHLDKEECNLWENCY